MIRQWRTRWFWLTRADKEPCEGFRVTRWTGWLCIGGKKPLADLPRWRRIFRVPAVRWRLL